jgi:hypothetical protein
MNGFAELIDETSLAEVVSPENEPSPAWFAHEAELGPESPKDHEIWHCTESQSRGLARLDQLADLYAKVGDSKLAGFRPACSKVLILGASGSGKTALAREFARRRRLPILTIEAGAWIVNGAAPGKLPTLRLVRDFLRSCPAQDDGLRGIIYVDELCKLLPKGEAIAQSGWNQSVFSEAISLLSGDERLVTHDWTMADVRRLQANFMVLGAGAFALAMDEVRHAGRRGALGFGKKGEGKLTVTKMVQEYLPEEILSRFGGDPIFLQSPTCADFEEAVLRIHSELGIPRTRTLTEILDEAENAPGGFRWAEGYLCELLLQHPYALRRIKSRKQEESPAQLSYDLYGRDWAQQARCLSETGAKLRTLLALIYSRLAVLGQSDDGAITYRNLLQDAELGPTIVEAIRVCSLNEITRDDREYLKPLSTWRQKAWQGLLEHGAALAACGIAEQWAESWSLATDLLDHRLRLSRAVQKGQLA